MSFKMSPIESLKLWGTRTLYSVSSSKAMKTYCQPCEVVWTRSTPRSAKLWLYCNVTLRDSGKSESTSLAPSHLHYKKLGMVHSEEFAPPPILSADPSASYLTVSSLQLFFLAPRLCLHVLSGLGQEYYNQALLTGLCCCYRTFKLISAST